MSVETRLIASPAVKSFQIIRQEMLGTSGFYRLRTTLADNSELIMFEYFSLQAGKVIVEKFSFHWQMPDSTLIRRWDNAPHHRHLVTAPNHLHEGSETNVLSHNAVDAAFVIAEIERVVPT